MNYISHVKLEYLLSNNTLVVVPLDVNTLILNGLNSY